MFASLYASNHTSKYSYTKLIMRAKLQVNQTILVLSAPKVWVSITRIKRKAEKRGQREYLSSTSAEKLRRLDNRPPPTLLCSMVVNASIIPAITFDPR